MALTARQARFVEEYLVDLNASQAAIRAGYSHRTADQQGYQLLQRPDVSAAISQAQASRSLRTQVTADTVLQQLDEARTADLADLYDDAGNLKPIKDWPLIWRQGLVAGMEVESLKDKGTGQFRGAHGQDAGYELEIGRVTKIKLADRIKVIELVGKHVGVQAFRERLEYTGPNGGPIEGEIKVTFEIVRPKG